MEIKEYVKSRKLYLTSLINNLEDKPKLIIIQVNEDEASNAYIKGKIKDLNEINALYEHIKLPLDITEAELISNIDKYNKDDTVDAILVQMPLPKHINEEHIKQAINPIKDVDGFHPLSPYAPCTPKGIMDYLEHLNYDFKDKNALVIGRSNIVGKPIAKLLLAKDANVTIVHSKTSKDNLNFYLKHADLIIVAVGKKYFIENQELNKDAYIIDVGINRVDGKLYGDCAPNLDVALQTPVPGGIGLLTRLAMLENLILCFNTRRK